ncbi:hypothetical protein [Streptomyces aureus]|uniref:hypothetical protein n=1 Tax=Streptomyces aureus TaxID=193461 RepID=UPI00363A4478
MFLITFGSAASTWVLIHTLGPASASAGSVLLATMPFLTGIHFLIGALMLDIQESPDRRAATAGIAGSG